MRDDWVKERAEAVSYFEQGYSLMFVSNALCIPKSTAKKWLYTYRALGKEALLTTKKNHYSTETKLAAVLDVTEHGLSKQEVMRKYGVKSVTQIEVWCRLYIKDGEDALKPKRQGRKPKTEKSYASREEELEARIQELELENALLKRINALADEIEQKRHLR